MATGKERRGEDNQNGSSLPILASLTPLSSQFEKMHPLQKTGACVHLIPGGAKAIHSPFPSTAVSRWVPKA